MSHGENMVNGTLVLGRAMAVVGGGLHVGDATGGRKDDDRQGKDRREDDDEGGRKGDDMRARRKGDNEVGSRLRDDKGCSRTEDDVEFDHVRDRKICCERHGRRVSVSGRRCKGDDSAEIEGSSEPVGKATLSGVEDKA